MSGVSIDFEANATSARKELALINRQLAELIRNSVKTNQSLGAISGNKLRAVNKAVGDTTKQVGKYKTASLDTNKKIVASNKKVASSFFSIKNAVIGLAAAFATVTGVNAINRSADALVNLDNRLRLVIDSTDELIIRQNSLYRVARRARAEFRTTVELYSDFAFALKNTSKSADQIERLTETLQKMAVLSGGTAQTIRAAFVQLKQGIASGTLRGEELNSVLEQLPFLGNALKESLKLDAGALRKFAEEGKLTTNLVVKVLEDYRKRTDDKFNKTSITAQQAVGQLTTSISRFFGTLSLDFGFAEGFATRIIAMTDAVDGFAKNLLLSSVIVKLAARNFATDFLEGNFFNLVKEAVLNGDVLLSRSFKLYSFYQDMHEKITGLLAIFITQKKKLEEAITGPTLRVRAETAREEFTLDEGKIPSFGQLLEKNPFSEVKDSSKGLLLEFAILLKNIGVLIFSTLSGIAGLFPKLLGPPITVVTNLFVELNILVTRFSANVFKASFPIRAFVESMNDTLSVFRRGRNVGRAFTEVFRSTSISDLNDNLEDLNREFIRGPTRNWPVVWERVTNSIRTALTPLQDMLISLGLIDSKLLRIRNRRLERAKEVIISTAESITRAFTEILEPVLQVLLARLVGFVTVWAESYRRAITDTFSDAGGRSLASALVRQVKAIVKVVRDLASEAFEGVFDVQLFDANNFKEIASTILTVFREVFFRLFSFISGFFSELSTLVWESVRDSFGNGIDAFLAFAGDALKTISSTISSPLQTVANALSDIDFDFSFNIDIPEFNIGDTLTDTFERVYEITRDRLSDTLDIISEFASSAVGYFADIFDKIVGRSFWPDTIDGINEYTRNIFESESILEGFSSRISGIFQGIQKRLSSVGLDFSDTFLDAFKSLENIDFAAVVDSILSSIIGEVASAVLFIFGGFKLKLIALVSTLGSISNVVDGVFESSGEVIGSVLARIGTDFGKTLVDGMIAVVNGAVRAIPSFIKSLFEGIFGPLGGFLVSLANDLAVTLAAVLTLFAVFTKKGMATARAVIHTATLGLFEGVAIKSAATKAGLTAGGLFMLGLFDSVGFFSSAVIAAPFLLEAIFGKGGVARLVDSAKISLITVFNSLIGFMSLQARKFSFFRQLFGQIDDISKVASPIKAALSSLLFDIGTIFKNIGANKGLFAAGKIGIADFFFKSFLIDTDKAGNIKRFMQIYVTDVFGQLKRLISSALSSILGTDAFLSLRNLFDGIFQSVSDAISLVIPKIRRSFRNLTRLFVNITAALTNFAAKVLSISLDLFLSFTHLGRAFLFIGFALFSGTASASSGLADFGAEVGTLALTVAGLAATLYAAVKAFKAFQIGAATAATPVPVAQAFADALTARQTFVRRAVASGVGVNQANVAGEALFKKKTAEAEATLRRVRRAAGFEAVFGNISRLASVAILKVKELGTALLGVFTVARVGAVATAGLTALSTIFPTLIAGAVTLAFQMKAVSAAFRSTEAVSAAVKFRGLRFALAGLIDGFGAFAKGLLVAPIEATKAAIKGLITLVSVLRNNLLLLKAVDITIGGLSAVGGLGKLAVGGVLGSIKSVYKKAFSTISTDPDFVGPAIGLGRVLVRSIAKGLAKTLPGAVITAGVGLLSVMFFGEGEGFINQFNSVIDKLRSFIGLGPITFQGRLDSINENLKRQTIGDTTLDFSFLLERIDLGELSPKEFERIEEFSKQQADSLKKIQKDIFEQGFTTDSQKDELEKIEEHTRKVLARQTQRPGSELPTFADIANRELFPDDLRLALSRGLQPLSNIPEVGPVNARDRDFGFTADTVDFVGDVFSDNPEAGFFDVSINALNDSFGDLNDAISEGYEGLDNITTQGLQILADTYVKAAKGLGFVFSELFVPDKPPELTFDEQFLKNVTDNSAKFIGENIELVSAESKQSIIDAGNALKELNDQQNELIKGRLEIEQLLRSEATSHKVLGQQKDIQYSRELQILEAKREQLEVDLQQAGSRASREIVLAKVNQDVVTELTEFQKSVKGVLKEDIGVAASKFYGSLIDVELLEKLVKEGGLIAARLPQSFEEALKKNIDLKAIEDTGKSLIKLAETFSFLESAITAVGKTSGLDDVDNKLRRILGDANTPLSRKSFLLETGKKIERLEEELKRLTTAGLGTGIEAVNLRGRIDVQRKLLVSLINTVDSTVFEINAKLKKIGEDPISLEFVATTSDTSRSNIDQAIDNLNSAVTARSALQDKPNVSSEAQNKAIQDVIDKTKILSQVLATVKGVNIDALAGSTESLNRRLDTAAENLGEEIPDNLRDSVALSEEWLRLTLEIAKLGADIESGQIVGDDDVARAHDISQNLRESKEILSEKLTIEDFASVLSDSGIEIDVSSLLSFEGDVFKGLKVKFQEITRLRDAFQKSSDKFKGESFASSDLRISDELRKSTQEQLKSIVDREKELLIQVRQTIKSAVFDTGEKAIEGITSAGVSNDAVLRLDDTEFNKILDLQTKLILNQLKLSDLRVKGNKDTVKAREILADTVDLQDQLNDAATRGNLDFAKGLQFVNEQLGSSLTERQFADLPKMLREGLVAAAADYKKRFREANRANTTSMGTLLQEAKTRLRQLDLTSFLFEASENIADTMVNGFTKGFQALKQILGDLPFDELDFARVGREDRSEILRQAKAGDAIRQALLDFDLSPTLRNVISEGLAKGTDNITIFENLRKAAEGLSISLDVKTPIEDLDTSLKSNTAAIVANTDARLNRNVDEVKKQAEKAVEIPDNLTPAIKAPIEEPDLVSSLAKDLEALNRNDLASQRTTTDVAAAAAAPKREADILAKKLGIALSEEQLGIGSAVEVEELTARLNEFAVISDRLAGELLEGGISSETQAAFTKNKRELKEFIEQNLVDIAELSAEYGRQFTSNVEQGFSNSLFNALLGFKEEGKSIIETFGDSILDTITRGILRTFSDSFVNALFGEESAFQKLFDTIGTSVASLAQNLFSTIATAFTGGLGGGVGGGAGLPPGGITITSAAGGLATGGFVSGIGTGTSDSIPAMLSDGEFVIRSAAVKGNRALLEAINSGSGKIDKFASGGIVGIPSSSSGNAITNEAKEDKRPVQQFNISITGDISRQTKNEIFRILPEISRGVNSYNFEKRI